VDLKKIQSGEVKLVKTGEEMIDSHIGGLLPSDVILLSGGSGDGKSETLFRMKAKILDTSINVEADQYLFLDMSLEMKLFNIVLRGVSRETGKRKTDILIEEFSEEDKKKVNEYYLNMQDERQYVVQTPTTPLDFYDSCRAFLETHKDKKAIFITADHMLLFKGKDKQGVMEEVVEYVNQLKLEFNNVYFILLSQLNRNILGRIAEKNSMAAPNVSDMFGSSFMDQICSYNIMLYDPYRKGIMQYMKINPERYSYLSDHFGDEDSKGKISFNTAGKIFYHVVKTRESDNPYSNIFIKDKDLSQEQRDALKDSVPSNKSKTTKPIFDDEKPQPIKPNYNLDEAFGPPDEDDDSNPF
tara:strand:+ start:15444 stop:16508 length:1065 start_codon:yes stop_codon:yes gene_type:complete